MRTYLLMYILNVIKLVSSMSDPAPSVYSWLVANLTENNSDVCVTGHPWFVCV